MPDSNKFLPEDFIHAHLNEDPVALALKLKPLPVQERAFLLTQLELHKKALQKLPSFTSHQCFYTARSLEQCSSERTALFKAGLVPPGERLLDLTGGLGVDDWAFSKRFTEVISLDTDAALNDLVRGNFEKLRSTNIRRLTADAESYLGDADRFDVVYADADRRPGAGGRRVASLEDSVPCIPALIDRMLRAAKLVVLKLSPMLDLKDTIEKLRAVKSVHVVSWKHEVKELIFLLSHEAGGNVEVHAVNISDNGGETWLSGTFGEQHRHAIGDEGEFLMEPAPAVIKAGLAPMYAGQLSARMPSQHTRYFLSDQLVPDFFGRSFRVLQRVPFGRAEVSRYLAEKGIHKANVSKRNFPMQTDETRKMFSLKEGGDDYLFFCTNSEGDRLMYHCRKPDGLRSG